MVASQQIAHGGQADRGQAASEQMADGGQADSERQLLTSETGSGAARKRKRSSEDIAELVQRMSIQGFCTSVMADILQVTEQEVLAALVKRRCTADADAAASSNDGHLPRPEVEGAAALMDRLLEDPHRLSCPVAHALMNEPVVAEDGFSYEREVISEALAIRGKSPTTNQPMGPQLVPNQVLKSEIVEFKERIVQEILTVVPNLPSGDAAKLLRRAEEFVRPELPDASAMEKLVRILKLRARLPVACRGSATKDLVELLMEFRGRDRSAELLDGFDEFSVHSQVHSFATQHVEKLFQAATDNSYAAAVQVALGGEYARRIVQADVAVSSQRLWAIVAQLCKVDVQWTDAAAAVLARWGQDADVSWAQVGTEVLERSRQYFEDMELVQNVAKKYFGCGFPDGDAETLSRGKTALLAELARRQTDVSEALRLLLLGREADPSNVVVRKRLIELLSGIVGMGHKVDEALFITLFAEDCAPMPLGLLSRLRLEVDEVCKAPAEGLCGIAEQLKELGRSSDAANIIVAAAKGQEVSGDIVAACRSYDFAFKLDARNSEASRRLLAMAGAVTERCTRLEQEVEGLRAFRARNCKVDIQIVGSPGVGKTALLEALIREQDLAQMAKFVEQRSNFMSHHQIRVGEKMLRLLDCSGNVWAQHSVKEWFGYSHWVFLVYDLSKQSSLEYAVELTKDVFAAGAKVLLFGNRFAVDQGSPMEVDIMAAKDVAVRNDGVTIESSALMDAVKLVSSTKSKPEAVAAGLDVKSAFGGVERGRADTDVLRPSLKGTMAMKQARTGSVGDNIGDLRPVQELQESVSAVTCICFGQEKLHKTYILLAASSKDGTVVIYRIYRTEMEIAFWSEHDFPREDASVASPPADHSNIAVHSRLVGHHRAVTSIFFNLLEDQLVTASIDKSVRVWDIESGEMLKVFTDSSPVCAATFGPSNPQICVAANSNACLRLLDMQNGMVLQKLKLETVACALKFDDTGLSLLAGTKSGSIHVFKASDSSLNLKFKVQLARGGVTCITFVPASYGQPSSLLVNAKDSYVTIIDCTYEQPAGVLMNLVVRSRVRLAHSLLQLKCCYSPSGQGYLISGSEDKKVHICSIAKGSNCKLQYLEHHQVHVVAVAVNLQDTLLASADSLGRIALWRRVDFSHLPE